MAAGEYRIHACARALETAARLAASSSAATQAEARERCSEASKLDLAEEAEQCIAQRLSAATVTKALDRVHRAAQRAAREFAKHPDQREQVKAIVERSGTLLAHDWLGDAESRDRAGCRVSAVDALDSPTGAPRTTRVPVRGPKHTDEVTFPSDRAGGARPALDAARVQRVHRLRRRHATEVIAPDRPGRPDPALSAPDRVERVPYRLAAFKLDKHLRAQDAVEVATVPGASTDAAPMVHPSCLPRGASNVRFSVPLADCRLMTEPLPSPSASAGGGASPGTVPGSPPLLDAPHGEQGAPPSLPDSARWWTGSLRLATTESSARFGSARSPLAARHATTASSARAAQLSASCVVAHQQRPGAPDGELNFAAYCRRDTGRAPEAHTGPAVEAEAARGRVQGGWELDFSAYTAHTGATGRPLLGASITGSAATAVASGGEVPGDISARERALLAGTRWKADEGRGRAERMRRQPRAEPVSERTQELVAQVASAAYGIQERRLSQRLAAHALGRPVLGLSTAERSWPSTSCYATL